MRDPKLIDKFAAALADPANRLLDELLRIAEPHNVPLYLVGGPLRDLLLERPSLDIDIAVEGDAMALARELAEATGGRAVVHPTFLTATVHIPGHHIDLITARVETYARPGALPTVRPATIEEDLLRRDFTVNALALRLNGPGAGEILDPTGGLRDLDAKLIRVLHERSFQDDPTRILRAARYGVRLSPQALYLDATTRVWLLRDLPYLSFISSARIHHELARLAWEEHRGYMLVVMNDLGILKTIDRSLKFFQRHRAAMDTLRSWSAPAMTFWPALTWPSDIATAESISSSLALTKVQRAGVLAVPEARRRVQTLSAAGVSRYRLVSVLEPFPTPTLWAVAAASSGVMRERLLEFLRDARHVKPALRGDDLLALGVPPGPQLGEVLRRLRKAKLNGEVTSREDEEHLVARLLNDDPAQKLVPAHPEVS